MSLEPITKGVSPKKTTDCLVLFQKLHIFATELIHQEAMTTTISLPIADYNRAKSFAEEQKLDMNELFAALIGQLTLKEEDEPWNHIAKDLQPYTQEELLARIEKGEAQFERGEYKTHEQLMAELQEELSWLQ